MGILERVIDNIQKIKTQGARSIAIAGLWAIKEVAKRDGFGKEFGRACKLLESSRPTAVALYNAIEDVRKKKTLEEINRMIYYFENVASLIVSQNYKIIKNNSTILTHCHSTLVVELLEKAWEKKIKFKVIVTETRPLFQGKKTAKELSEIGIPVIFITDSAAGFFIKDVDSVLMGVDAIRKEGVVNKIGSYPLAVLAKENDIPVYFAGETMKLDRRKKIIIEERDSKEIIERGLGKCEIRNPAFDITPWKYVAGVVTEKGILKPRQILRMLR